MIVRSRDALNYCETLAQHQIALLYCLSEVHADFLLDRISCAVKELICCAVDIEIRVIDRVFDEKLVA